MRFIIISVVAISLSFCTEGNKSKNGNLSETNHPSINSKDDSTSVVLLDTNHADKKITIRLINDSIISIKSIENNQSLSDYAVFKGFSENISLKHKGLFIEERPNKIKPSNVFFVNDSLFVFSALDFKYRSRIFGVKTSKDRLSLFETNSTNCIPTIEGEMQFAYVNPIKKTILTHSQSIAIDDTQKEIRRIYFYQISDSGCFQLVKQDSIINNQMPANVFYLDGNDNYLKFYQLVNKKAYK